MRAVIVTTGIGVAIVLSSVTGWAQGAQVCHSPRGFVTNYFVSEDYVITKDIEAKEEGGYKFFYHPFGERIIETRTPRPGGSFTSHVMKVPGPVFEDCCNCGDNENTAYQLKIYSKDQDPTRGEKFDKPVLITQGFDVKYGLPDEQFMFAEFQILLDSVFDEIDGRHLPNEMGLLRQLYEEGYDIALLLWKNPNIHIPHNALVVLQALRWLEGHTEDREGTEPVIIGPSMGGLVTRYALQLAGEVFPESGIRCRLLIAFDSPNRGAEVPMSLQALLSYLRDEEAKSRGQFINLTSQAARQMLLSLVRNVQTGDRNQTITDYEDPNTEHGRFMRDINEPEFLKQIKNITHKFAGRESPTYTAAIINGSGMGIDLGLPPDFTYGAMEHLTLELLLDTPTPNRLTRVFSGNTLIKRRLTYFFQEPAFMENTPGGLRPTYLDTRESLDEAGYSWNQRFDRRFVNHSFIPSLSGAGLLDVDINDNRSWFVNIDTMVKGIFDEVRVPVRNQNHVAVTRENKQWFLELIRTWGPRAAPVEPIAETACMVDEPTPGASCFRAFFGYNNPNSFTVTIPIGENNKFMGRGFQENAGQPEDFLPGRQSRVFPVIFGVGCGRGVPEWFLDGITVEPSIPVRPRPCPPLIGQRAQADEANGYRKR